jgi:hypothetical protein
MATDVNLGMLSLDELRRLLGQTQAATPYSQVGVSPYQQIMSRMPLLQNPYAGVSGGYNNFQGGYNPNLYSNAPRAIGQLGFGGGGGSGGSEPAAPSAWSSMTPAEQAAYYAANPTMATITQLGQKAFGLTALGALQRAMNPGFVSDQSLIAMGVNPAAYQSAKESFRASEISDMNAAAEAAANAAMNAQAMQSMQDALAADTAASQSVSDQSSAGSEAGGYGTGDTSGGFGEGQYNMGGPVDKVVGPNPPGPDDGAGMLQLGEYVIKKSAVKKYGQGLLDMINDGKIPAKKMKSLLG